MLKTRLIALALLLSAPCVAMAQQAPAPAAPSLDFEFFRQRVMPILTTQRPGHARTHRGP